MFFYILVLGVALVFVQAWFACTDGFLTQKQLKKRGIVGYSFMEHGGMWADVFIISPLVAYIVDRYDLAYTSWWGILTLIIGISISLIGVHAWARAAIATPEAHTHNGKTTIAGSIHAVYAIIALWICLLFYIGPARPNVSHSDLLIVSSILTPFFILGAIKFSSRWRMQRSDKIQIGIFIALVWIITITRLIYR